MAETSRAADDRAAPGGQAQHFAQYSLQRRTLLSNAVKYTPTGGTVTVSLRRAPQDPADGDRPGGDQAAGTWVELSIRDAGIGMTEQETGALFTNFYRAEHVRKAAIPGTGLGLAISQGFVRAHGGEIDVVSEKDVGSTFTVRLPVGGPSPSAAASTS